MTKSVVHKILTIISLALGIVINMNLATVESVTSSLSYFTNQSNLFCLISFIVFLIIELKGIKKTGAYYIVKGGATMAILTTAIIYNGGVVFMGVDIGNSMKDVIGCMFVHIISPIMVLLDYFLYEKKGRLKMKYALCWIPFSAYYLIYAYIYPNLGGRFFTAKGIKKFAYPFLDYEEIGYEGVVGCLALIVIVFIGIGILACLFDQRKNESGKRGKKES